MLRRKWHDEGERKRAERRRVDRGTQELQVHRLRLVQGGDPSLSTCPLDVLLALEVLSAEQHQAGWIYALLHRQVYGSSHPRAVGYEMVGAGVLVSQYLDDLEGDQRRQQTYRRADLTLKRADCWARKVVRDTVLGLRPVETAHGRGILRTGLNILCREFGLTGRAR
jgi:hypothetical protein